MNILNPDFKYTNSARTDISKTIRRERKRLDALKAAQDEAQKKADEEAALKVTAMGKRKA